MAKQINTGKEQGLFAATPPLEALRVLLSATITGNTPKVLMLNDISRAYLYARSTRDKNVELCDEDKTEPGHENRRRKLIKSMYGTRAAAHEWQSEVTKTMTDLGIKQGKASPCVFWHRQKDIKALVCGDDFVSSGERAEVEWLVLDYADLFTIVLRNDDIQEFDTRWDDILLSMEQFSPDDILVSLYKLRKRESEKLKTLLDLYNLKIHQKKAKPDYHRLKTMVKRNTEHNLRSRNFEGRNERIE